MATYCFLSGCVGDLSNASLRVAVHLHAGRQSSLELGTMGLLTLLGEAMHATGTPG